MFLTRTALTIVFCVSAAGMAAAEPKALILQTQPEPTVIELTGNVQINPSTGNITAVPVDPEACSGSDVVSCDDVSVQTSSFSASPSTVEQGQNVQFSWTSRGAWACEAVGFGSWASPSRNASGSNVSISTADLSIGSHTAQLTCFNGPVTGQTRSVNIEVIEPDDSSPAPVGCEGRTLPSNWSRMTTGSNSCSYVWWGGHGLIEGDDCRYFNQVYPWNWDEQVGIQRVLGMSGGNGGGRKYIAMEFNSGNTPADKQGQISINQPQTSHLQNRRKLISISKCPGDFNQSAIQAEMGPGCLMASFTQNFQWGGSNYITDANRCGLEPNTTYYFNIVHTNAEIGTAPADIEPHPDCTSGAGCGSRFTP